MGEEEVLSGGVANVGAVTRVGDHVLRPSNSHSLSIHEFLSALYESGFRGASRPVGIDPDGRERLEYIEGAVPTAPYPEWAQTDQALVSTAELIRRLHDASATVEVSGSTWCGEMADPFGGSVICHNDVCLENVVFRDGRATALVDFDFAAPGRRVYDVASFARKCVPIDDPVSAGLLGWGPADLPRRLRVVADAYGLNPEDRAQLPNLLRDNMALGERFVRERAQAGEPGFVHMWDSMGGHKRFDRRRQWWSDSRAEFARALA